MLIPRFLPATLCVLLLGACSARTVTTTEETVEAGGVALLTVEVRASVIAESTATATPTMCVAIPSTWAAPTATWARGDDTAEAAAEASNDLAVAHRDVAEEGLSWHCFTTPALSVSQAGSVQGGRVVVSVSVPEDAEGVHSLRTLGLWVVDSASRVDEARHRLRVEKAPTDTFDFWEPAPWDTGILDGEALWQGDRFVGVRENELVWSADGRTWTNTGLEVPPRLSLSYGNGVWVGADSSSGALVLLDFAEPELAWRTTFPSAVAMRDVTFARGLFVAVGDAGRLLTSPDGRNWTSRASTAGALYRVVAGPDGFIAFGERTVARSTDGVTWRVEATEPAWELYRPVYGHGRWLSVAGGEEDATPRVVASTDDGASWQPVASLAFLDEPNAVWFVDGRFVVADEEQAVYGGTYGWAPLLTGFSGSLRGFAQDDERVVVLGEWGFAASARRRGAAAPEFLTRGFPQAMLGESYAAPLTVTGGQGVVAVDRVEGALPPGLSVTPEGLVGTPTEKGSFTFSLRAADEAGGSATQAFTLEVTDPLRLPDVERFHVAEGDATELRIPIRGGTPPYDFDFDGDVVSATVEGAELVLVFKLSASEVGSFTVYVVDDAGGETLREYEVLGLGALEIADEALDDIRSGVAWSAAFRLVDEAPVKWSVDGTLPEGLRASARDGELLIEGRYEGVVEGEYPITIKAVDPLGVTAELRQTLKVVVPPRLNVTELPGAFVGQPYSFSVHALHGQGQIDWEVDPSLPAGLAWTQSGSARVLSGTTQEKGRFLTEITVTDARGLATNYRLWLGVGDALTLTQPTPDLAIVGRPYALSFEPPDDSPHRWAVIGELPPGLATTLDEGVFGMRGVPTQAGTWTFSVTMTDEIGVTHAWTDVEVEVVTAPELSAMSLPLAYVDVPYEAVIEVVGGTAPFTFSLGLDGELPDGLTLEAGTLKGAPAGAGTFAFSVIVTDAHALTATRDYELTVRLSPPSIATEALADGKVGAAYEARVEATGGTPPYTWSMSGDLPTGVSFGVEDGDFVLAGTPTMAGAFTFTVKVVDADDEEASRAFTLTIAPVDIDEKPDEKPEEESEGCGGCDATGATSLLALAGLGLLRKRRGMQKDFTAS